MISISSPLNPQFRTWKSLLTSKGIRKEGLFLLSGEKLIHEMARSGRFQIVAELIHPDLEAVTACPRVFQLSKELFNQLDELGTHHSILVLEVPKMEDWDSHSRAEGVQVFSPLGDPQNLGALLRSCEAFGVHSVVLLAESAHPFLPKTIKASSGSSLRVPLFRGPSLRDLSGEGWIALDMEGTPLPDFKWPASARLILGEEGPGLSGLSQQIQVERLTIPTQGVESLNATVAASLALGTRFFQKVPGSFSRSGAQT